MNDCRHNNPCNQLEGHSSDRNHPSCISFDTIFSKYYHGLIRFGMGFKIQSHIVEELAADAMIKLWQRFDRFENHFQMKSFLYTSVRFGCLNANRDNKRKPVVLLDNLHDPASTEDNVNQSLVKKEIWKEVRQGVKNLPPQCRAVVESLFLLELDTKFIASELKVTVSTVRNQKARGLKLLRGRIKP
ncbi:MAG: sigma-70 family RNA polymerase sigma factor [Chitinophagaceae bacterium]